MVVNDQTLNSYLAICVTLTSVTRLGDLLDFGQVFKAFGNTVDPTEHTIMWHGV